MLQSRACGAEDRAALTRRPHFLSAFSLFPARSSCFSFLLCRRW
jgi:hypothetical protein